MATFNTTDPKPGYVYNSSDDTWYPLLGLATQSLDGLTDVVITTPTTGQILAYNGTDWINQTETGDLTAVTSGTGITITNATGPIPSVAVDTAVVATTNNTLTLTNKTLALGSNTISGTIAEFNTALTDADFATIAGSQTLTNKTLALGSNTVSGTIAQFNTALTDGDFATLAGSETLTNKTLTTPTLTLSSTSSTTSGRISFNATDDKIIVGDGTNAVEFAASTLAFNPQTGTTYTFALTDKDKMVTANTSATQTYTVPANSSAAFAIGSQVNIIQIGTGQVTISPAGGVSIVSTGATTNSPKLRAQYSSATLIKRDTDLWYVVGDIS
jgi:hypothetical protein